METIYLGADGTTYTETELWNRYESGTWRFCMGDADTGRELVETDTGDLLMLSPVGPDAETEVETGTPTREESRSIDEFWE